MFVSLIGIILGFAVVLFLVAKGVDMAPALVVGTIIAGIFSPLSLGEFGRAIFNEVSSDSTIQLVIAVTLISGLGRVMQYTGALDLIVHSLVGIFRSDKLLCMLIPALFGTLNVPGGAIMSAPLVEQNARRLSLNRVEMSAINVFFRHIGYFIYPLYPSLILMSELTSTDRLLIIRHNVVILLGGLITAYFLYFRGVKPNEEESVVKKQAGVYVLDLFLGFAPVLLMLTAVVFFNVPFYLATLIGVAAALLKGLPRQDFLQDLFMRCKRFFTQWMDYKVALTILGVMCFKAVIESSNAVNSLLEVVVDKGISLPLLVAGAGLTVSYATGVHVAATGLLAPIFAPLFPQGAVGPFTSLLFTAIILGYLISPLHLCLTFSNRYYKVNMLSVYKKLLGPLIAMLVIALLQVYL